VVVPVAVREVRAVVLLQEPAPLVAVRATVLERAPIRAARAALRPATRGALASAIIDGSEFDPPASLKPDDRGSRRSEADVA
jgi:hypothetical protein